MVLQETVNIADKAKEESSTISAKTTFSEPAKVVLDQVASVEAGKDPSEIINEEPAIQEPIVDGPIYESPSHDLGLDLDELMGISSKEKVNNQDNELGESSQKTSLNETADEVLAVEIGLTPFEEKYPFKLAEIRNFMREFFKKVTPLRELISNDPELREVRHDFSDDMTKNQMISTILEYAERQVKLDYLKQLLESEYQAAIETNKLTDEQKPVSVEIPLPLEEITKQIVEEVVKGIANKLEIPPAQASYVHIQPKSELASKLNTSVEEIHFEYNQSTLLIIALPKEKADELIRLDRAGRLEEWKKSLKIVGLKIENNLDRYIEVITDLVLSAETSSVSREDKFKEFIAHRLRIATDMVRFVTLKARVVTFGLNLSQQEANNLIEYFKADKLKDLGIQDFKIVHSRNGREEIFCKLIFPTLKDADEILYSKSMLAEIIVTKISNKFGVELNEENILWQNDRITFTFVMPSINVAKLFHYYRKKMFTNILDLEIQDLRIGRYDWKNYLGLIVVGGE